MEFSFIDDSNQMYIDYSLKIVDGEGVVLMALYCRHERQWTVAGFCRAGRGLAHCWTAAPTSTVAPWISANVRRFRPPLGSAGSATLPPLILTRSTTRTFALRVEPASGSAWGKYAY